MRIRLLILIALLFSRVFVTPVWYSVHINDIKDPTETFEQVRLKKRRSSFIEEEGTHERSFAIIALYAIAKKCKLKTRLLKREWAALHDHFPLSFLSGNLASLTGSLFLRNRVLRI